MKYAWKTKHGMKGLRASVAYSELDRIREENEGRLTPALVLQHARQASSPLHSAFDWDDSVAAEKWRLEQAGQMIRSIVVIVDKAEKLGPMRALVHVLQDGDEDKSYTTIDVAMSDENLRTQVIADALREVKAWRKRYAAYEELSKVFEAVDALEAA